MSNSESLQIGLVAVTGSGVRLYFSTTGSNLMDRPSTLCLQHVRLPPGFAPSSFATAGRPSKVHMSYYKSGERFFFKTNLDMRLFLNEPLFLLGTLLLSSAQNEASDQLWLISGDSFPLENRLMEGQSTLTIDGRVWALEEIPYTGKLSKLYKESFGSMESPFLAVQHAQISRRFVVISAQGTHIVSKLRPADHLRQLMIEHGGADSNAVKAFFSLFGPVEASAIALILACSQAVQDAQVAEWATRAFLLYGRMPIYPQHLDSFHPNLASTPAPHTMPAFVQQQQQQQSMFYGQNQAAAAAAAAAVSFSAKHNGLYLYFSRLVRPVWLKTLVVPTSKQDEPMTSTITSEEIDWINAKLLQLKAFIEQNLAGTLSADASQPKPPQDVFLRERQSLMFLQQLIHHTFQVLGLWKAVVDHQVHVVASRQLHQDDQNVLKGMYFRDLIISVPGREMSGRLVQAVIGLYLGDNAKTDAISYRLRQACPSLYNVDDTVASKAHEMIIGAKTEVNLAERQKIVSQAIGLCKKVAGKLNLDILVSHLVAVHAYIGVVDICLASAQKRDPQAIALHFYKNGEPQEDQQGLQAFVARSACYKHVTFMLKKLWESSHPHAHAASPLSPGSAKAPEAGQLAPQEAVNHAENVFHAALKSNDELFHVELYRWLLQENMHDRLLDIKRSTFLEDFLTRGTAQQPNNVALFDLLWKYYKKNNNYLAAAKILAKLADRHSTEIHLNHRIEYLSRAIVCIKSEEMDSHRSNGAEMLHELEEQMEVARVQLSLVEEFANLPRTPDVEEAINQLNNDLMDISRLYADFAEPYKLWECQLAILHCAGHPDSMLIETVWDQIINQQISKTAAMQPLDRVNTMANKIKALGKLYSSSQKYFPLGKQRFIVYPKSCPF